MTLPFGNMGLASVEDSRCVLFCGDSDIGICFGTRPIGIPALRRRLCAATLVSCSYNSNSRKSMAPLCSIDYEDDFLVFT
jgi:hypothetical protein